MVTQNLTKRLLGFCCCCSPFNLYTQLHVSSSYVHWILCVSSVPTYKDFWHLLRYIKKRKHSLLTVYSCSRIVTIAVPLQQGQSESGSVRVCQEYKCKNTCTFSFGKCSPSPQKLNHANLEPNPQNFNWTHYVKVLQKYASHKDSWIEGNCP